RMQVSVEPDIAGESGGATRPAASRLSPASVRNAKARTSAKPRGGRLVQNPGRTYPMVGNAKFARASSIRLPRVRNAQQPYLRIRSRLADAGSEDQAVAKE